MESNNVIEVIFNEIVNEALNKEIILHEYEEGLGVLDIPVRMGFTINNDIDGYIKINIEDKNTFIKLLKEYAYNALIFYDLDPTKDNIKKVITYLFSNISNYELNDMLSFLEKRISYFNDNMLKSKYCARVCDLGYIEGKVDKQSILQETPYCFKSSFTKDNKRYNLPRISFGIKDDTCYIYAIQNKDVLNETMQDSEYNELVHRTLRTINSGIKKYRNVTPSFVITLIFFISYLKDNGITNIRTIPNMPLRIENRKLVNNYKVNRMLTSGTIALEDVEKVKYELEEKRIMDVHNSTKKFADCFERLKVHFNGIYLENIELTDELVIEVIELVSTNRLLSQVVAENKINMVK